jgi:hypothetical protein
MKKLTDIEIVRLLEKCVKIKKYKAKISELNKKLSHFRTTSDNNDANINKLEIQLLKTKSKLKLINLN